MDRSHAVYDGERAEAYPSLVDDLRLEIASKLSS
jgi:hypothetical protein